MSEVSPYQPPKSELVDSTIAGMGRKGRYLVLKPEADWPSRCIKCNSETDYRKQTTLVYLNPWIYLSLLINLLVLIFLALIFRKKFTVQIPLCAEHSKKRRNYLIFQWILVAILLAAILAGIVTEEKSLAIVCVFLFLVVVLSAIFGRLAYAAKYKKGYLWIRGAGRNYLDSLPEHVAASS